MAGEACEDVATSGVSEWKLKETEEGRPDDVAKFHNGLQEAVESTELQKKIKKAEPARARARPALSTALGYFIKTMGGILLSLVSREKAI